MQLLNYINYIYIIITIILIVAISSVFCNALEHLGEKLNVSEGVTGSILSAISTALPETIIPILALFNLHNLSSSNINRDGGSSAYSSLTYIINSISPPSVNAAHSIDITIAAILGAPLMLSTLSLFIIALVILPKRGLFGAIKPEAKGTLCDLRFFLVGYALAFISIFLQDNNYTTLINPIICIVLFLSYGLYLRITIKNSQSLVASGHATTSTKSLYILFNSTKIQPTLFMILIQLCLALMLLIYLSNWFIYFVSNVASMYNVSQFIVALIIIPIATELPEKVNSLLWLRRNKDTLAINNITGSLVFQGLLLPILGLATYHWQLNQAQYIWCFLITFIATLFLYINIANNRLKVWHLFISGLFYLVILFIC